MNVSSASPNAHLTSGRLLARNTIWNLVGGGAPMLVAIVCIPILIKGLGKDRFGVLALAWVIIGYAGFFDLGVGRALTQFVARKLGAGEDRDVPPVVWTSLALMLLLGIVGGVVVALISPWLVHRALHIPAALQQETLHSFYLLGLSLPIVISTAGLRGFLEAHQRFDLINALRVPLTVFSFAGPLLVLPFSRSLFPVLAVLVGGRVVGWVAHLLLCFRVMPGLRNGITWHRPSVRPLLAFGGWLTVTNVVGPLMLSLDRFLIGALLSVTAIAYYATSYELVARLFAVPGALVGVMFPAFSASFTQDPQRAAQLYDRSLLAVACILAPVCFLIVLFVKPVLILWVGSQFAEHSFRVAQILSIGVLVLGLESIPFALLQAIGRPDLPAKLNIIELPLYFGAFWFLTVRYGLVGAAAAWSLRAFLDGMTIMILANRYLPGKLRHSRRSVACLLMSSSMAGAILIPAPSVQVGVLSVSLAVSGVLFIR